MVIKSIDGWIVYTSCLESAVSIGILILLISFGLWLKFETGGLSGALILTVCQSGLSIAGLLVSLLASSAYL